MWSPMIADGLDKKVGSKGVCGVIAKSLGFVMLP